MSSATFHSAKVPVGIEIGPAFSRIYPPLPFLREDLEYSRSEFEPGGPHGYLRVPVEYTLCQFDAGDGLIVPTGLVPRLRQRLEKHGHLVNITDRRVFDEGSQIDPTVLARALGDDQRFLTAVASVSRGQLETRNGHEAVDRIVQIFRLFPHAKIVVAAATRKQVRKLAWQLRRCLRTPVGIALSGTRPGEGRLMVSTLEMIRCIAPIHVLILADIAQCGGMVAKQTMGHCAYAKRVYGFVKRGAQLGPANARCVEAITGPVIYRIGPELAIVSAAILTVASFPQAWKSEGLERKRKTVWHNTRRNDAIAKTAIAMATGDLNVLGEMGLFLDEPADVLDTFRSSMQVAILVESTEHAHELLKRLPAWEIGSQISDANQGPVTTAEPVGISGPTGMIVTFMWAALHGIDADVVIRADGGSTNFPLKGFPPAKEACSSGRVFFIDIADDFDNQAARASRHRLQDYRRRGWLIDSSGDRPEPSGGMQQATQPRRERRRRSKANHNNQQTKAAPAKGLRPDSENRQRPASSGRWDATGMRPGRP
ncbi:MAG: hypothetical protein JWN40_2109 [Phycisphaerales bacterium]|nr:hypothetical protein [Phycisphaerales bacterium]